MKIPFTVDQFFNVFARYYNKEKTNALLEQSVSVSEGRRIIALPGVVADGSSCSAL